MVEWEKKRWHSPFWKVGELTSIAVGLRKMGTAPHSGKHSRPDSVGWGVGEPALSIGRWGS